MTIAHTNTERWRFVLALVAGLLVATGVIVWITTPAIVTSLELAQTETRLVVGFGLAVLAGAFLVRFGIETVPLGPALPSQPQADRSAAVGTGPIQPGFDVDGRLEGLVADQEAFERNHEDLTADLRAIALDILSANRDFSRVEAAAALDKGTWTADPYAAGLFANPRYVAHRVRIARWLSPRETYRRQVEAAIAALYDQVEA